MHFLSYILVFGEGQGRVVISVKPENQGAIEAVLTTSGVPFTTIGEVTEGEIFVDEQTFGNIAEWRELYVNVLDTYLEN